MVHLEVSSQDFEFTSNLTGVPSFEHKFANCFSYFDVVLMVPFISFLPEMNNSVFLDVWFSFPYNFVHHNYSFGYESLKSLCCGNIFFNSVSWVVSFFYLYRDKNIF